jgi:hypothetical protein
MLNPLEETSYQDAGITEVKPSTQKSNTSMNTWCRWRPIVGILICTFGGIITTFTYLNRHNMPQYISAVPAQIKTVTVYKDNPLAVNNTVGTLGPTMVDERWEFSIGANKGTTTGEYQFKDAKGIVQVLKFCNLPAPDFKSGSVLTLEYIPYGKNSTITESMQKDNCVLLTKAQVVSEPKK